MTRISITETAHKLLCQTNLTGAAVIDATLGNGFDSVFLAEQIGPDGQLFGFDIQAQALHNTQERLQSQCPQISSQLFQACHAQMKALIPSSWHGRIQAIMFNLGYLPGADKTLITQTKSTLTALNAACELLAEQGMISVIAYPGHAGGAEETDSLQAWCQQLDPSQFSVERIESPHQKPHSPRLFVIRKQPYLL